MRTNRLISLLCLGSMLWSCDVAENEVVPKIDPGKVVNFSLASAPQTKTVYSETDYSQILWSEGDQVKIFCANALTEKSAVYNVGNAANSASGTLQVVDPQKVLQWSSDDVHDFYAVYPADAATVDADGKATFKVKSYQTCVVETAKDEHNKYVAKPDMSNAYMVAKVSTAPADEVKLSFSPIMTTLNILVKGEDAYTTGGTWFLDPVVPHNTTTRISSVSIIKENADMAYESTMNYDINSGDLTTSGETGEVEYRINLEDRRDPNNVKSFVELKSNWVTTSQHWTWDGWLPSRVSNEGPETDVLQLIVFLPPFDIKNNDNERIKIRIYNDELNYAELSTRNVIPKGNIAKIALPAFPKEQRETEIDYTKWITPLTEKNPDILVSQLSLPGSHASVARGIAQSKTVAEQWDAGVRVFDLSTAVRKTTVATQTRVATRSRKWRGWPINYWASWPIFNDNGWSPFHPNDVRDNQYWGEPVQFGEPENELYVYHQKDEISPLSTVVADILNKVSSLSHEEFAVVLLRRDDVPAVKASEYSAITDETITTEVPQDTQTETHTDTRFVTSFSKGSENEWKAEMKSFLEGLAAAHPDNICTDFRPDLTIGDLANKILFITLDEYDGSAPIGAFAAGYTSQTAPTISDIFINPDWSSSKSANGVDAKIQDCNVFPNDAGKETAVKNLIALSGTTLSSESTKTDWFINFASGYRSTNTFNSNPYRGYLTYADEDGSYSTYAESLSGPSGILLMDFAGEGGNITSGGSTYVIKGQQLLQAIIKNNYKYEHLTK